jgi:hypothetical protein
MKIFAGKMQKNDGENAPNIFASGFCEGKPGAKETNNKPQRKI